MILLSYLTFLLTFNKLVCTADENAALVFQLEDNQSVALFVTKSIPFQVALNGNPSTGYSWNIDETSLANSNVKVEVLESIYIPDPTPKNVYGAGGKYYFNFKTSDVGDFSLSFLYKRNWEPFPNNILTGNFTSLPDSQDSISNSSEVVNSSTSSDLTASQDSQGSTSNSSEVVSSNSSTSSDLTTLQDSQGSISNSSEAVTSVDSVSSDLTASKDSQGSTSNSSQAVDITLENSTSELTTQINSNSSINNSPSSELTSNAINLLGVSPLDSILSSKLFLQATYIGLIFLAAFL